VSKPGDALQVTSLGRGRYQLDDGITRRVGYAVQARDTWVFLDGQVYVIPDVSAAPRRRQGDDQGALTAPMPATVLAIHAVAGQRVQRDDTLLVLEAMKMELPIRAPRDGVVTRIACRVGELVQPGVTLLELGQAD